MRTFSVPGAFISTAASMVLASRLFAAGLPVQVLSRNPVGPTESINASSSITVTFNQPMVSLGTNEDMAASCPLVLDPPVKGRCRWMGTQTLAYEAEGKLPPATKFRATIPKGTKSQVSGMELAEDASWEFETVRPAVIRSNPHHDEGWVELEAAILLFFNLDMDPRKVSPYMRLVETGLGGIAGGTGARAEVPVTIRIASEPEIKAGNMGYYLDRKEAGFRRFLLVKPTRPLLRDRAYNLVLKAGLPAAGGNLGLLKDRIISFETWYTFAVTDFPEGGQCLPPPKGFRLGFTNPVRYGDLIKHMIVTPARTIGGAGRHYQDYTGDRDRQARRVFFNMPDLATESEAGYEPDMKYTFRIDGRLKDIFGNVLGKDVTFELSTGPLCPYLRSMSGFGVLEGYLKARHPITLVNVPEVTVGRSVVKTEDVIPVLANLDGGSVAVEETTLKGTAPRNKQARIFVDMAETLGGAQGGFVYFNIPGPRRDPDDVDASRSGRGIDNITRTGLTIKSSPDSTLVLATHLRTGKPMVDVPIELRDEQNKVLWTGKTDAGGFADAPGLLGLGITTWKRWKRPALWAIARNKTGDAIVGSGWHGGLEPWRFNIDFDWNPRPVECQGLLFTERGIYRPGEMVYLKGYVRTLQEGDWAVPGIRWLSLVITDSRRKELLKATVTVTGEGSFHWSYQTEKSAPTGAWFARITNVVKEDGSVVRPVEADEEGAYREYIGREMPVSLHCLFRVEEYKPAVFEVKAIALKESIFAGDEFAASIKGWYLAGAPMVGAPADWSLRLNPRRFSPPGLDDFLFYDPWENRHKERMRSVIVASGSAMLDGSGTTAVSRRIARESVTTSCVAEMEAGVTSPERQRMFGRTTVVVHPSGVYIGIRPGGCLVESGKPWKADVILVDPDGKPVAGAELKCELKRREWLSVKHTGPGGRLHWTSEVKETVVEKKALKSGSGPVPVEFKPDKPGSYSLSITAVDAKGRASSSGAGFYGIGKGESWWQMRDDDIVELVPDRDKYKPGDTARIMVKSPFEKCQILVTLEREKMIKRWVESVEGNAPVINVPLTEECLPNVYVGVVLLSARTGEGKFTEGGDDDLAKPKAKFGYASLPVDPGGRRLKVGVEQDRGKYKPGEKVSVALNVSDEAGKGTPAELAVYAVDEGVLALTDYRTPDIFGAFYGPRPLKFATADTRVYVIGQREFGEKGKNRGGDGGAGPGLPGVDLRTRFMATAYWNPAVSADKKGKASVSFNLPDNLSRFRIMAVASAGKLFGSGENRFTVSKQLMLKASLPRLARIGDSFDGGVVVHNNTDKPMDVKVGVEMGGTGIEAGGPALKTVSLKAGEAKEMLWPCKSSGVGTGVFRFRAVAGRESDGLEWKVPVGIPERLEVVATTGVAAGTIVEGLARPASPAPGTGNLRTILSSSALAGLQESAQFLLEYPYGCLEQKLSRCLPVITGADLVETFKLGTVGDMKREVQDVLDRLKDFQHPSGGFGYWPDPDLPDPYITSYALEAAYLAGKEGYRLPAEDLGRAIQWLRNWLSEKRDWAYPYSRNESYVGRAYAIYALSLHGAGDGGYFSELYQVRDQVPFLAKAYMLKAAGRVNSGPEVVDALASGLLNQARRAPASIHFEEPTEERMPWVHGSTVKTTAMCLQALLDAKGGFPGDEKVVLWITGERKMGRWRSTQENGQCLWVLQDYYRRYEKAEPDFKAMLTLQPGTVLHSEVFKGRSLLSSIREFPLSTIFAGGPKANLSISCQGKGRLYYALRMSYAPANINEPAWEGFEIEKTIRTMDGKDTPLKAGQRGIVTLIVRTKQDRTFVAVDDPIPAGYEIVNTSFATEGKEDTRKLAKAGEGRSWWGSFRRDEKYDDRILVFADFLSTGEHKYSYMVQATTPGRFHVPATWIEQMYEPEVFARTASRVVEVRK